MNRSLAVCAAVGLLAVAGSGAADPNEGKSLRFFADLSGAQEVTSPPGGVVTRGSGKAQAQFDTALTEVRVNVQVRDLTGTPFAAHFHCGRPGQNGPVVFGLVSPGPLGFADGRIRGRLTNADFNGADCEPLVGRPVTNIAALAFAMRDGLIYLNVHTDEHQGGEVRGQMLER